jgi:hypothetical protein
MATIHKDIPIEAGAAAVWDAIRDVGAVHERLAVGFVVACRLEDGARVVKFANGVEARELIVGVAEDLRRVAYSVVGSTATHHNASMQVVADGEGRCRLVWITDMLPDQAAATLGPMIEHGSAVMKRTLERR